MRYLLSSSLLAAAIMLGGCTTNPSTGREQLLLVSADELDQMGIQATPELIKEYGGEVRSRELRNYVKEVGQRLVKHVEPEYKDVKWEFITLESEVINAFALPPGNVFMSRGLLEKLDNEAELAAVLGHEMGHITARHVNERVSMASGLEAGAKIVSGAVGGSEGAASQLIPLVVGFGGQGYLLKFSRDQETEADSQGLKYMTRAGYDPRGAAQVMQVLIDASQGGGQWEILSTHPDPERRLNDVLKQIREEYSQDSAEYKKFAERWRRRAEPYLSGARSGAR